MNVTIIGGGIIGLNCAYYLHKAGHEVTVFDEGTLTDGCSFGNLGYVSTSHFVPLATPGIIWQGIKWMLDSSSPFYIKPRLDLDLLKWGMRFYSSANHKTMSDNIPHLNNLLQLSRCLIKEMKAETGHAFDLLEKGCWMLYKNEKTGDHEKYLADQAERLGLRTLICDRNEVQRYEDEVNVDVLGGVMYCEDCYVEPGQLMRALRTYLVSKGVRFLLATTVKSFEKRSDKITAVVTSQGKFQTDEVVVANGSQMPKLAAQLNHQLLLQPGKGYSFVYHHLLKNLKYPAILADDRVAVSPYGRMLRIGGTMELSGHDGKKMPKRIMAIYNAFRNYYPDLHIDAPDVQRSWYGYRPVTPDGMPYIGRTKRIPNLCFAGGHAMLGVSAAAGTGKLIAEIISSRPTSIAISAFHPNRFD